MSTSPDARGYSPVGGRWDPATIRIELIPLKSVYEHLDALSPGTRLSVTCSPKHGLGATLDLVTELRRRGHNAVPHIAARQLRSHEELRGLVARFDSLGVTEAFIVGGDAHHDGPFVEALAAAKAYRELSTAIRGFGFAAYPDGHGLVDRERLAQSLHRKQDFLRDAELYGHLSTQMCFDAAAIASWSVELRESGIELPVHLGVPGHVDRIKLAKISARLGVGSSLSYLKKNKSSALKLMGASHFEPTDLIVEVTKRNPAAIAGLHVFSFNNVEPTKRWLDSFAGGQQH